MSALTLPSGVARPAAEADRGPLSRLLARVVAVRAAQAHRQAAQYLASCSDERLRGLGLSDRDIAAVRSGTYQGPSG